MNRNKRRISAKNNRKSRVMLSSAHVLIAVVALIECLLLIAFTTYSWIETASSLVIMNGRQTTTVEDIERNYVKIDIAKELTYQVDLDASSGNADLNKFFSHVKYYRYGKASSTDGKTFYFPKRNNTHQMASDFRLGDTTDYNTSYTYFDFEVKNTLGKNKDFFFSDSCFADGYDVFKINNKSGYEFTDEQLKGIKAAMRISINDVSSNGNNTHIYSVYNGSSETYIENGQTKYYYSGTNHDQYTAQNGTASNATSTATVRKLSDYNFTNGNVAGDNHKELFTSKNNVPLKVSVRIWFEIMDPIFQHAFGFGINQSNFDSAAFNAIPGVEIGINLAFGNADNNFVPFYFDDYTFSTVSGHEGENITAEHLGDENSDYIMTFTTWNPEGGESHNGAYQVYEMEFVETANGRTRWSAPELPMTVTNHLKSGITDAHYNSSYFTYGERGQTGEHTWVLDTSDRTGDVNEFIYNAYSVTKVDSFEYGVGTWNNTSRMTLLQFKDKGTVLVQNDFNRSADNYQIVNQHPVNTLFANNISTYNCNQSNTLASDAKKTATMYYDAQDDIFKSYVPNEWLNESQDIVYFRFNLQDNPSATGTTAGYGYNDVDMKWVAAAPATSSGGNYIYTNLGQGEDYYLNYYQNNKTYVAPGIGTWGAVEKINFNVELIDYRVKSTDRFKVCIDSDNTDFNSTRPKNNYTLIPNAEGMVYSAYVPSGNGLSNISIRFLCVEGVTGATDHILARWYSPLRDSVNDTFYPTAVSTTTDNTDPCGYWNLSVLVDGSYENLIYDTLTDGDGQGRLEYSLDGGITYSTIMVDGNTAGTPTTDSNRLDEYRWYIPCQVGSTVLYRWTPYYGADEVSDPSDASTTADDTVFTFSHNTSYGMYLVITEASDTVNYPDNSPITTRGLSNHLASTGSLQFEAEVLPSASQLTEDYDGTESETAVRNDLSEMVYSEEIGESYNESDSED